MKEKERERVVRVSDFSLFHFHFTTQSRSLGLELEAMEIEEASTSNQTSTSNANAVVPPRCSQRKRRVDAGSEQPESNHPLANAKDASVYSLQNLLFAFLSLVFHQGRGGSDPCEHFFAMIKNINPNPTLQQLRECSSKCANFIKSNLFSFNFKGKNNAADRQKIILTTCKQ